MLSFSYWGVFQKNRTKPFYRPLLTKKNKFLRFLKIILWLLLVFSWLVQSAMGEPIFLTSRKGVSFQVNKIADSLGVPWGMVFISPDKILFTERKGKIGILVPASGEVIRISGGPKVMHSGQGGLLDVCLLYTSPSPRD